MASFRVRLEMEEVKQKTKDEEDVSIFARNICSSRFDKHELDIIILILIAQIINGFQCRYVFVYLCAAAE